MSDIRLSYEDGPRIVAEGNQAIEANDAAKKAIANVLASSVHIGVVGKTQDAMVLEIFQPFFDRINSKISALMSSTSDALVTVAEVDNAGGIRMGNLQ